MYSLIFKYIFLSFEKHTIIQYQQTYNVFRKTSQTDPNPEVSKHNPIWKVKPRGQMKSRNHSTC